SRLANSISPFHSLRVCMKLLGGHHSRCHMQKGAGLTMRLLPQKNVRFGGEVTFVLSFNRRSIVCGEGRETRERPLISLKRFHIIAMYTLPFLVGRIWRLAIRSRVSPGWSEPTTRRTLGFSG